MPPAKNTTKPKKKAAKKTSKTTKVVTPAPAPAPAPAPTPAPAPVTKEVTPPVQTETPVVSDTPYHDDFSSLISDLDTALNTIRLLKSRVLKLEKTIHREHKTMAKKLRGKGPRKPRDPNAPKSGFAKEGPVSDEMRKFLSLKKDALISRTDVTRRIHEYCKSKDLQNPADKRHINADASLRKLLRMTKNDDLTFFNLQKFMKIHFPNKEGIYPTA